MASRAKPPGEAKEPGPRLRLFDVVAMIVGVVVGAGIFRAPSMVAGGAASGWGIAGLWALGGGVSLVGALCYGELVSAFPSRGGEYHFLSRAFGSKVGFLFAWARLTVITTGSIALLAFIFGDYAAAALPIGPGGSGLYAAGLILTLTALNIAGLRRGRALQNVFTALVVLGLLGIALAGFAHRAAPAPQVPPSPGTAGTALGLAMVFVLLTFGGWNEAAYLSAEVSGRRRTAAAMVGGVAAVTLLYVLVNLAYLRVLGLEGLRASTTVGADVMARVAGPVGARLVAALIAIAALTSANATIVTGARAGYALGRDFHLFRFLGRWDGRTGTPVTALLAQALLATGLVVLGGLSRRGFETMVEYTAPVFWAFFLLTGLSLFVLRRREPNAPRPFRVPLYPLTPVLFCLTCAWLLHASLAYTRVGALVGLLVLGAGAIPLWWESTRAAGRVTRQGEERA